MAGAIKSEVFGGPKDLHEESEEFIKSKLDNFLPRACLQVNSLLHSIARETKETRDYHLYKLVGFESFGDYCKAKLNHTEDWYNALIDFQDAMEAAEVLIQQKRIQAIEVEKAEIAAQVTHEEIEYVRDAIRNADGDKAAESVSEYRIRNILAGNKFNQIRGAA